jgi:choline dehydrogenase-like flavoprotein
VSHEPRIAEISTGLEKGGYHPFHAPCGILLDEANRPVAPASGAPGCDGYPCLVHAKSDAEVIAVRPVLGASNVTLVTGAEVTRLETDAPGARHRGRRLPGRRA